MSAVSGTLARAVRAVRMRITAGISFAGLGIAAACVAIGWRLGGVGMAVVAAAGVVAMSACAWLAAWQTRRIDPRWIAARLDASREDLEDSAALLSARPGVLGPLQRLQRERIEQRLRERPAPDLRPRWPWRAIAFAWLAAALAIAWALAWPRASMSPQAAAPAVQAPAQSAAAPRLLASTLRIDPPGYTGLDASASDGLDAKVPVGSRLRWTLRFVPQPAYVELALHDGKRIALRREGEDWTAEMTLTASMLYRIVAKGEAAQGKLHRIDAVPDRVPRVRVRIPERGLILADPPPRAWTLSFEAEDDYGLASEARLLVTRTEGTGENIRFHEHVLALRGRGDRRNLRFDASVVPSDFGLQRGEDLVARIEVRDNHSPRAQTARSASVILRWPEAPVLGAEGLEGLARQVLPAYFRSQRQVIIDAEALLKEKSRLAQDVFAERSDGIGVDQRLLRLRYGQFLGEESEGGSPPPTNDLPTNELPTNEPPATHEGAANDPHPDDAHVADTHHEDGAADDGHGHGGTPPADTNAGFGDATGIVDTFGHTHDLPEAATLLDPGTREILRKALREMWQSELHLRQAAPQQALPYAYRALEFIKQVQQAERIYLQRVGSQLPPIDETRRMGGKREGIAPRALPAAPAREEAPLRQAWQALGQEGAVAADTLDAVQAWADTDAARLEDPLALVAAIDALRMDPACTACRGDLRGLLWAAVPRPAGGVEARDAGDARGRRYLELLERWDDAP